MKFLASFSRIVVGTLFIFSGLIKANDILGFSYKLEEYWVEFGIGWDWLIALDVPMAALICIVEVVLGIATLVGYRMKLTSFLLMAMIVFFTILTFASAQFGLVKSCGCFGDAIPLTPWQSFYKDLILLILISIIFVSRNNIEPLENADSAVVFFVIPSALMAYVSFMVGWNFPLYFTLIVVSLSFVLLLFLKQKFALWSVLVALIASSWFSIHTLCHLPMKDFRPYAAGKSIIEGMTLPEGAKPDVFENTFIYKNKSTGEEKKFNDQNYPWDDDNWEFVDRTTVLIEKGDEAPIKDFSVMSPEGEDFTDGFLNDPEPIMVVIAYNIDKADEKGSKAIGKLSEEMYNNGMSIIGLSASDQQSVEQWRHDNQVMCDFFATDEITLKTIVRSNPGLMLIEEGKIIAKWHHNDVPTIEEIKNELASR